MNIGILGGGLSGIALAYALQNDGRVESIKILEKEAEPGGLCRSYEAFGLHYDIGPHIIFSKNDEILKLMLSFLGDKALRFRRSNKIHFAGRLVKYPFENDLAALPEDDRAHCVESFLSNPYAQYDADNMLQFFLKTFGEGITNRYLRPYNEKIWKFDPAFMDTQMVERIPRPPTEDILASARGIETDGYLHQLNFYYPSEGGIRSLLRAIMDRLTDKVSLALQSGVKDVSMDAGRWFVTDERGDTRAFDRIVSTIPIPALASALRMPIPQHVLSAISGLRHNSIIIAVLNVRNDLLGNNFAVMTPDPAIIFHRVSKLDFLLPAANQKETSVLMAEVTFRQGDWRDRAGDGEMAARIAADLVKTGFISDETAVMDTKIRRFEHAYVVYDLNHRRNTLCASEFIEGELGIFLCGRFGEYKYLNMDGAIENALQKASEIGDRIWGQRRS